MKKIRGIIIASAAIFGICLLALPVWAIKGEKTYVFAASACPPWKTKPLDKHAKYIAQSCRSDVEIFTRSVKEALSVPSDNIFSILNEQATYEGLKKGLREFADIVPKGSRVIMLFNFHGVLSDSGENGSRDEVLVLWTEDKPFTLLSALALKQWISAGELRGMIDAVRADEIVIVVDACHSDGAVHEIIRKHGRDNDWQGREAVITSSKADQFSYFMIHEPYGLFSYYLSESLRSNLPDFERAFENAAMETGRYLEIHDEECSEMLWEMLQKKERCVQTPVAHDPTNLLPAIKLDAKDSVIGK